MSATLRLIAALLLISSFSLDASAKRKPKPSGQGGSYGQDRSGSYNDNQSSNSQSEATGNDSDDDSEIVAAVNKQRSANFISGANMEVVQLLPDDNSGLTHQKFVVRLSNGKRLQAVYNTDMCPRLPVKVGDKVGIGGQFIWTNGGGLIHWLHHDPRGNRPAGYVEVDGTFYCRE